MRVTRRAGPAMVPPAWLCAVSGRPPWSLGELVRYAAALAALREPVSA